MLPTADQSFSPDNTAEEGFGYDVQVTCNACRQPQQSSIFLVVLSVDVWLSNVMQSLGSIRMAPYLPVYPFFLFTRHHRSDFPVAKTC